jgi:hypothetical protein
MKYIDVAWLHESDSDPFRLVSELDDQRFEVRKLEFFRGGAIGFASGTTSTQGTGLGIAPVPELKDINSDAQFQGVEIGPQEFEFLWDEHTRS